MHAAYPHVRDRNPTSRLWYDRRRLCTSSSRPVARGTGHCRQELAEGIEAANPSRRKPVRMATLVLGLLAVIFFVPACGGDSPAALAPAPPPRAPTPPPVPPPPAPATPQIRFSANGSDFVEWVWDPVEGATSYEADVAVAGASSDERTRVVTEEPRYRWEGLAPDTAYVIWVRAIAETAGGRARSGWSRGFGVNTLSASLMRCTNEREQVLRYGSPNHIAREWTGRPFRFHFDEAALRQCGENLGLPDWYETEIVGRIESAAVDFEARLGYRIFEAIPAADGPGVITITTVSIGDDAQEECERANGYANVQEATLFFSLGYCDPACRPPREVGWQAEPTVRTGTAIHELGHILGMHHHDRGEPDDTDSRSMYGLEMSEELDGVYYTPRIFTEYDIDRLGCAYPLEEVP